MSKFIIIKEENADKIMSKFNEVQGKARTRLIENFDEILDIIKEVDDRIGKISKTAKNGTVIEYNFQQHFPNAYEHAPMSTHFIMMHDKGSWRVDIESIKRNYCPNKNKDYSYNLKLSETAKAEILKRYE